jgi:ubiquinone biosynthesis UbiH/UbiF/VisC/COQ6 family hydroxylase
MIEDLDPKVCVVGGGLVGLTFALLCADKGIPTALIEAGPAPEKSISISARVSALNICSLKLLQDLQVWPLAKSGSSGVFRSLHIWDALTGAHITFDSADVAKPYLGYNVDNADLIHALWDRGQDHPHLRLLSSVKIDRLLQHNGEKTTAVLTTGELLQPDCLVGADGAQSWLREQIGIDCNPTPYEHHALVTVVQTEKTHQEQGWQVFLPTGPLALLPLADRFFSAVVWSMPPELANTLYQESPEKIAEKMNEAFGYRLGKVRLQGETQIIPLIRRHAQSYSQSGVALIGDAAHTIHPLAGQGANLGFRDAQALSGLMANAFFKGRHLGHPRLLARYERERRADNQLMMTAMQLFQQGFGATDALLTQMRKWGIRAFEKSRMAKRLCMQYALGEW